MTEETQAPTITEATQALVSWVADMKRMYRLNESTILDLFRIQLMWVEQAARQPIAPDTEEAEESE